MTGHLAPTTHGRALSPPSGVVHLRRDDTSVILRVDRQSLPVVLHWGASVPDAAMDDLLPATQTPVGDSVAAAQPTVGIVPLHANGWLGAPGLLGGRADGAAWSFLPTSVTHSVEDAGTSEWREGAVDATRLRSVAVDRAADLELTTELELHPSGIVRLRATLRNTGAGGYRLSVLEPCLPVPAGASELLDLTGRWGRERTPQRHAFGFGRWAREAWGGRPGHDNATVLCAGVPGFGFRRGTVWGVHLAWSGNGVVAAEKTTTGWQLLRGGEVVLPGEIVLGRGAFYTTPWIVASWGDGLDRLQERFHRLLRSRPNHPRTPRPVTLNTWEAVYFDQDIPRLLDLADRAADLGVERFVLDDGWFLGRRDDTAGLGDWYVDPDVWPAGLTPLVERVHEHGMQFGLWFEPEMVDVDSALARMHPDWLFGTEHGPGIPSRHQHVLDLGHPEAYEHILGRISALVAEYAVDYIKWDHNRPLIDAGHQPRHAPGVHDQTRATYRLIDELKTRFPDLEIESCAGGGARIDLGIMERCDRVWVSDCIDAHERQRAQRWSSLLLPPEMLGTHVGAHEDHTTGRTLDLDYRAGTAIWGHLGIEWDLAAASAADLTRLADWVTLYKKARSLLHSGTVVHEDPTNPAVWVEGVVSLDQTEAMYRIASVEQSLIWPMGRITLPGLRDTQIYRVQAVEFTLRSLRPAVPRPAWTAPGVHLTGAVLGAVGLVVPLLDPDRLVIVHATAAGRSVSSA